MDPVNRLRADVARQFRNVQGMLDDLRAEVAILRATSSPEDYGPVALDTPDGWVVKYSDGTLTYTTTRPTLPLTDSQNFIHYAEATGTPGEYIMRHDGTLVDPFSTDPTVNVYAYWNLPAPAITGALGNRVTMEAAPRTGDTDFAVDVWYAEDTPDGTTTNFDNNHWFESVMVGLADDGWVGMSVLQDPGNVIYDVLWVPSGPPTNLFYFDTTAGPDSYVRNLIITRGLSV